MQLLYLDSRKAYLFKDELDGIASRLSIRVSYLDSKEDLHRKIDMFTSQYKDGNCFVAGPKPMVDSVSGYLQKNNVPKRNIKKDAFFGYS